MTVSSCIDAQLRNPISNFERELDLWIQTQVDLEDASDVKNQILQVMNGQQTILDLSNTKITHLPEGFNPPDLERLNLSNTKITHLPEGFNPPKLKYLDLDGAYYIRSLPEGFNPPQLETLILDGTGITTLPEGFNPPHLERLFSNTKSLMERIGFADRLYSSIGIRNLPEDFNPYYLKCLYINSPEFTELPEVFNPPSLEELDLSGTGITGLPEGFNPPHLQKLNLSSTEMTSLPETLFNLPSSCTIYLTLSNFSSRIRENLQERVSGENYQGPRFEFSMASSSSQNPENSFLDGYDSLEETFEVLFEKAVLDSNEESLLEKLIQNRSQLETENLRRWLNRLFETASAESNRNAAFFEEVVDILEEAGNNENFRNNVFYRVLDEASTTCGDRVALSVLHLGIQKDLENLNLHNPKELADFLTNGVMILDLLENYANETVPTLPLVDPLEVYLGLPVYFKQEFNIPINTEEMLFFNCAGLDQCHLDAAREKLKTALDDEDKVLSFLIEQPKWLECLKKARPEKMRELEKAKDRRLEEEPFEKAEEILEDYNQGLKDLTKVVRRIARFSLRIRA